MRSLKVMAPLWMIGFSQGFLLLFLVHFKFMNGKSFFYVFLKFVVIPGLNQEFKDSTIIDGCCDAFNSVYPLITRRTVLGWLCLIWLSSSEPVISGMR